MWACRGGDKRARARMDVQAACFFDRFCGGGGCAGCCGCGWCGGGGGKLVAEGTPFADVAAVVRENSRDRIRDKGLVS